MTPKPDYATIAALEALGRMIAFAAAHTSDGCLPGEGRLYDRLFGPDAQTTLGEQVAAARTAHEALLNVPAPEKTLLELWQNNAHIHEIHDDLAHLRFFTSSASTNAVTTRHNIAARIFDHIEALTGWDPTECEKD